MAGDNGIWLRQALKEKCLAYARRRGLGATVLGGGRFSTKSCSQGFDLTAGCFERAGTVNFLGGITQFFVHGKLHGYAAARFVFTESASAEAFELLLWFAPSDNEAVELLVYAGLDDQRRFDEGSVANAVALPFLELTKQRSFDTRVDNGVEAIELGAIREDNCGELVALDAAICADDGRTKFAGNFVVGGLAGLDQFVRKGIGVEDGEAQLTEQRSNGALAAGDAAGEAKSEHGDGLSRNGCRLSCGIFG